MKKIGRGALTFWVLGALIGLACTIGFGWKPLLGLDLQGGLSATLTPKKGVAPPSNQAVEEATKIIRQRVDGLGIAEPEVVRSGKTVVVQLPGLKSKADQERAKKIIGTTAKLEFRKVLRELGPEAPATTAGAPTTTVAGTPTTAAGTPTTATPGATSPNTATSVAPTTAPPTTAGGSKKESGAPARRSGADGTSNIAPIAYKQPGAPSTTAPPATSAPGTTAAAATPPTTALDAATATAPPTTQLQVPEGSDVFTGDGNRYLMGPVEFEGSVLSDAQAQLGQNGTWEVNVTIKGKDKAMVNKAFNACYAGDSTCPAVRAGGSGQPRGVIGMVLDGKVISAPTVDAIDLPKNPQGFVISGSFTKTTAEQLALQLRYGALPVEFEPATMQTVSATLGSSSLHAGVISGLVGLAAVALYMILFYRLLGLVAVFSLLSSTAVLWTIISYMGTHSGLALTLAGITGIIVSLGVAVDSNVVFYEHLREDMSTGRSFRSCVDKSFQVAWGTIVSADFVSIIGAVILYFLTVGSVRGFAFYLGLSTLIDLLASWFFMRPVVFWMARSRFIVDRPKLLGVRGVRSATKSGAATDTEPAVVA